MPTQFFPHEAPGLSSIRSQRPTIFSASPCVASVLPGLMRSLADEIERGSSANLAEGLAPNNTKLPESAAPLDVQSYARQVACELSIALSHHLDGGFNSGPGKRSRQPVGSETLQKREQQIDGAWAGAPGANGPVDTRGAADVRSVGPRLRLKLLGTPEVTLDGVRLQGLERCGRASLVIYILALHPGGLSGESLAAYISSDTPDIEPCDIEANLTTGAVRTFIWRLRRVAGWRGIVVSPGEEGGSQNRYRLPDDTACDLWEFERTLDEAARLAVRANIERDAADQAAAMRQDAISLYGGEFCKGVGSGSISRSAVYLRQRYLQAVMLQATYWKERAVRLRTARQERGSALGQRLQGAWFSEESAWLQALDNYRLAIQAEPFDETLYLGAMLCEAQLGHARGVEQTLAVCTRVMRVELERDLFPATLEAAGEFRKLAADRALTRTMKECS